MAKTEDIEAKLAAFVDGELDPAERAEIEKHLATHPTHQQLIDDLMRQRQMMRELPRLSAPADVADTVNAQLERAILLGDVGGDADAASVRSLGTWPRIRAIAAVLLLMASLAAVIASLLPSLNQKPADIASLRMPPPTTAEDELAVSNGSTDFQDAGKSRLDSAIAGAEPAKVDSSVTTVAAVAPTEQQSRAMQSLAEPAPGGGRGAGGALADTAVTEPSRQAVLQLGSSTETVDHIYRQIVQPQLQVSAPNAGASPFVYVLSTDNPDATNRAVTRYLASNNIQWEAQNDATLLLQSAQQQGDPLAQRASVELKAKQVTLSQVVALRMALDSIERQPGAGNDAQQTLTMAMAPASNYMSSASRNYQQSSQPGDVQSPPSENRDVPTTSQSPAALDVQRPVAVAQATTAPAAEPSIVSSNGTFNNAFSARLGGSNNATSVANNTNFAPFQFEAPDIDLKGGQNSGMDAGGQMLAQNQLTAANAAGQAAALPEEQRVDFLIVVQPQANSAASEAAPTTNPVTQPMEKAAAPAAEPSP